jgi:hypothetical protein
MVDGANFKTDFAGISRLFLATEGSHAVDHIGF